MGGCGSKSSKNLIVEPNGLKANASAPGTEVDTEATQRSLAGNLMQSHMGHDSLRVEDEYDDSDARILGSGMSGQVSTVRHRRTGTEYALKTLNIHQLGVAGLDELRREIDAMRRLDHPNICKIFEIFESADNIHMILELCTGGELVARIMEAPNGITEREAAHHLHTMLSALSHCHENAVVHRDVKLDNFVYEHAGENAELKLIDFGLSHLGARDEAISAKGRVGTLSYMAPEVLRREPYAFPSDMWSLGVVAFILLAGRRPFHSRDREEKIELIKHAEPAYSGPGWRDISAGAVSFVKALLKKAPGERMTATQALQHPWLQAMKAEESEDATSIVSKNLEIVRSLQAFSTTSQLHKVALELLAFSTPSSEVDQLRQVFVAIDTDGSGAISREEFKTAMAAHPQFHDAELRRLFDQIDFSGQGELSYNEFLAATLGARHTGPPDEEKVRAVFEHLDADGDGIVTREDLMRALGTAVNDEEIDRMFSQLGCSKNRLYFADLLRLMQEEGHGQRGIRASVSKRRPSLSSIGKSLTMSDVVLETEAKAATKTAPTWLAKGRSVQNLNKFLKGASELADERKKEHRHTVTGAETAASVNVSAKKLARNLSAKG